MPELSVVILNWNNKDVIENCLNSVHIEIEAIEAEIIIVDNGSTDGSLETIKKKFPQVQLIENEKNLGFARGVNQGVKKAVGKYILLLGSDTEVQKESIKVLLKQIKSLSKEYGVVAPQLLNKDGSIQSSCRNFPTPKNILADITFLWKFFPKSKVFGNYRLTYWDHDDERDVVQPQMTALLIRSGVFEEIGVLDEDFPIWFNDVDWSCRLKKAGYKIRFAPDSKVTHIYGESVKKFRGEKVKIWRKGLLKFYKKWYGNLVYLPLRLFLRFITIVWIYIK